MGIAEEAKSMNAQGTGIGFGAGQAQLGYQHEAPYETISRLNKEAADAKKECAVWKEVALLLISKIAK